VARIKELLGLIRWKRLIPLPVVIALVWLLVTITNPQRPSLVVVPPTTVATTTITIDDETGKLVSGAVAPKETMPPPIRTVPPDSLGE
jgi:hypothetical protein